MEKPRTPLETVSHVVKLYHRGILGPSLMWLSIADALSPSSATAVLNSLPSDVKEQLLDVYCERPPHAYIAGSPSTSDDKNFQPICVQVVLWCEANSPGKFVPTEPDGLIRVCVEGDLVREWRPWERRDPAEPDAAPQQDG